MTDHTPTPWYVETGAINAYKGDVLVDVALADRNEPWTSPTERDANVRRIVTCVNACEGLSTKALETTSLAGTLEACILLFEGLAEQTANLNGRDGLLESAAILRGLLEVPNV
jgi:hypothetical protein